jgi:hypothetical protein
MNWDWRQTGVAICWLTAIVVSWGMAMWFANLLIRGVF